MVQMIARVGPTTRTDKHITNQKGNDWYKQRGKQINTTASTEQAEGNEYLVVPIVFAALIKRRNELHIH